MVDVSAAHETSTPCFRLVIADRQPIVLQGLRSAFAAQHDFEIVASCSNGTSCLEAIRNLAPDVVFLADTLPNLTASELLAVAKAENLSTRLVFFTESESDDDLSAAIAAGACSAISKYANPDILLRSLRSITKRSASPEQSQHGSPGGKEANGAKIEKVLGALTHRERQIVQLVADGMSNKEIARQLNVSYGTVKVHLHNIFQKLEISNRTVLATIALLQRPSGFGTLALALLAFGILDDVRALERSDTFQDDDSTINDGREHPGFEIWKKAILRHVIIVDPGERDVLTQKDSSIEVSQVTNSAAGMEVPHVAEQTVLSSLGRSHGPIGSGTSFLSISPLLQAINDSQIGSLAAQQQFPPLQNPMKNHGGYGAFMMTVGAWIYALDHAHAHAAVQSPDPGETLIDTSTIVTMDGITKAATIAIHGANNIDHNDVDHLAPGAIVHDFHPRLGFGTPGHDSVTEEAKASQIVRGDAGDAPTINGNDTIIGGYGGDQLTGGNGDDIFVCRSATRSNSAKSDVVMDFTSGAGRINLAAFGALAFLHMTSASQSVPPHTLAWIYNPASNETIVYVNSTDRSLDIGDAGLVEIHLQGVVSIAESDFVYQREEAAVAAASDGIDAALLVATVSDGTALTTDSGDASIEAEARADVWTIAADNGLRFHFGRERMGANISARPASYGDGTADATEESDGAAGVSAHVSSIELARSNATVPVEESLTFRKEHIQANIGALSTGHGAAHATAWPEFFWPGMQSAAISAPVAVAGIIEPGVAPGNSAGHGNSEHASVPVFAKAAVTEPAEPGILPGKGVGHGTEPQASNSVAAKAPTASEIEPGVDPAHSKLVAPSHSASASAIGTAEPTETGTASGDSPSQGHSEHASEPASANAAVTEAAAPGIITGNGLEHGTEPQDSNSAAAKAPTASEMTEPGVDPAHGNSESPSNSASASATGVDEPMETSVAPDNSASQGNLQHASQSAVFAASEGAQPAEAASEEPAFRFNNLATPSPSAPVELEAPNELSDLVGHDVEVAAILEVATVVVDEHTASTGQHHGKGFLPHDLLI